jgi:hypothetical protein
MRWFRRNVRFGSLSALVALTLQLALALGHSHFGGLAAGSDTTVQVTYRTGGQTDLPPAKRSKLADYCAICATIHLVSSLLPGQAPSMALAPVANREAPSCCADAPLSWLRHALFEPRGPPIS